MQKKLKRRQFLLLQKKTEDFIKNKKLIVKAQQRFKGKRHNVFTKETNKVALS